MYVCKDLVTPETTPEIEVVGARKILVGPHGSNKTLEAEAGIIFKRKQVKPDNISNPVGNGRGALTAVLVGGKVVGKSAGMAVGGGKNLTNQEGMLH